MMSQKEMFNDLIVNLRQCADELLSISDKITELLNVDDEEKETTKEIKPITLEEVRKVLAELSRDGFTANIRELLKKHGADKLSEIKPDDYAEILEEARDINNG